MKVLKKSVTLFLLFICFISIFIFAGVTANADTGNNSEENQPRGIYTSLSISIDGRDGKVWAIAKNSFTMFPSTVYVIVQLYSSETYQDSYQNMKLEAQNSITDLDMGETITATAPTNGVKRYWKGRIYYKIDSKSWKEKVSETGLFGGDGIVIV